MQALKEFLRQHRLSFSIHREGWPFVVIFALVAFILSLFWEPLGWIGLILTLWCLWFFRDPERATPIRSGLVVSPADGVVCAVGMAVPPPGLGMDETPRQRVCVFMNVFNVHVNRVPLGGRVESIAYHPGKFFNASLDKASTDNERMAIRLIVDEDEQKDIAFVQIAGLVARRIRCDLLENQKVKTGERFGMIRFGSRVDVYLPQGVEPLVGVGQTMIAGETVLADLGSTEAARVCETR